MYIKVGSKLQTYCRLNFYNSARWSYSYTILCLHQLLISLSFIFHYNNYKSVKILCPQVDKLYFRKSNS